MIDKYIAAAGAAADREAERFDDARIERLLRTTTAKLGRRRRWRAAALALAAVAILGTGSVVAIASLEPAALDTAAQWAAIELPTPAATPTTDIEPRWALRIGESRVERLHEQTVLDVPAPSEGPAQVVISAGAARFDARDLVVVAAEHRIAAEHAVFVVDRTVSPAAIWVEEGEVRIESGALSRTLSAGDRGQLAAAPKRAKKKKDRPRWRRLVKEGRYEEAYEAMKAQPTPAVTRSADSLMAAADAARHSGHPREAVGYLKRVIDEHPTHALAPLAAFTLGRVYLVRVGEPRLAALAFAKARALKPGMQFAEDALAREVEAWAKAGEHGKAKARAREYLRKYPDGRRADRVRKRGGL